MKARGPPWAGIAVLNRTPKPMGSSFAVHLRIDPWRSRPQARQWRRRQPVAERHDISAVVEDDAEGKAVPASLGQCPKAGEVPGLDRGARLHLDPHDHSVV